MCLFAGIGFGVYKLSTTKPFFVSSAVALLLPREKPTLDISVNTSSIETGMDSAKREASGPLMLPPNTDLYTTILQSRPVLKAVATKFAAALSNDEFVAPSNHRDDSVRRLRRMLKIHGTDEGMITIEVTANNRDLAAAMANEFVVEMERASKTIERQLILQQSGFLAKTEQQVTSELTADEHELAEFYARHGVVDMATQASDILRMQREQKQSMFLLEQEIMTRLGSFTEDDDGVRVMRQRLKAHRDRIEQLNNSYLNVISKEDFGKVRLEYDNLHERVRYKRDLLATIATQRAVFQIRAQQPAGSVAALKTAVPATRPAGPSRKLMLGLPGLIGLITALVMICVLEQWSRSARDPYILNRLGELRGGFMVRWLHTWLRMLTWPVRFVLWRR